MKIDLHIHSTASDGTLSPSEILNMAQRLNLGAISITDHDTINGTKEALAIGIPPSVKFLTGVEISVNPPPSFSCPGSFHILGYGINIDDTELNHTLARLQEARKNRNPRIIERLNRMGFELTLNEIRKDFGECQLGRPHIAKQMVKKGFVQSVSEAFDSYLATGQPAYVDKYRIDCDRAIEIILNAGGIPVLAHPVLLNIKDDVLENLISCLKEMGLKGIEAYYPEQTPDLIAQYTKIADRHGLLITGGTDFHGSIKPEVKMGSGRGNLSVPYELYEKLISSLQIGIQIKQMDLSELTRKLSYEFKNTDLLVESLRHSSFVNEQLDTDLKDNECLEFLGDAVLNLVVGHILMQRYPDLKEGDLSRMRANLVNESQLASIARGIDIGSHIQLGKGEIQSEGWNKQSILANTFEAVIAAVYIDGGFDAAFKIIDGHFSFLINSVTTPTANHDFKSQIQELVQMEYRSTPIYTVVHESGPDHDKTFRVQLSVGEVQTEGIGKSKKAAEQDAARKGLDILKSETPS